MMDNLGSILNVALAVVDNLGSILNIALAVAAIASVGGVGYLRGTITNLRGQLADTDREVRILKDKRITDATTIAQQANDIAALQRTVTGADKLDAISEALHALHGQAADHWAREEEMHTELLTELRVLLAKAERLEEGQS